MRKNCRANENNNFDYFVMPFCYIKYGIHGTDTYRIYTNEIRKYFLVELRKNGQFVCDATETAGFDSGQSAKASEV